MNKIIEIQKHIASLKHIFNERIDLIQSELRVLQENDKDYNMYEENGFILMDSKEEDKNGK